MNKFIQEYRMMGDDGDKWGTCVTWAFALCDYLTVQALIPDKFWEFKQSPCGADSDDVYYSIIAEMIEDGDATIEDLKYFDRILQKYYTALKKAGYDY